MFKYLILFLGLCTSVCAQEVPTVDPPKPLEKVTIQVPKGVLGEGKRLSPYVFDSSTKCYLTLNLSDPASLKTLVWYTEDGPPDIEPINSTLENPGTILSFSSGNTTGLFLVEADWDKGFSKVWLEIKGSGPSPPFPPKPVDPDIPPGPVDPIVDPNVQSGFRVITVYESASKLTKEQSNIMTAVRIRKYLDAKCSKGTDGQYKGFPEYRFWDKDGKDSAKDSPSIKKMWDNLKPSLTTVPMPFMAIEANGKKIVVPLREGSTVEAIMTKLIEIGGPE